MAMPTLQLEMCFDQVRFLWFIPLAVPFSIGRAKAQVRAPKVRTHKRTSPPAEGKILSRKMLGRILSGCSGVLTATQENVADRYYALRRNKDRSFLKLQSQGHSGSFIIPS